MIDNSEWLETELEELEIENAELRLDLAQTKWQLEQVMRDYAEILILCLRTLLLLETKR